MSKPIKEYKSGKLSLAVWEKDYEGKPSFSFSLTKNYKDKEGTWKTTNYLSKTDLFDAELLIARVLAKSVKEFTPKKEEVSRQELDNTDINIDNIGF
jgi:hypothetical protein